jgi:hypothetical protein
VSFVFLGFPSFPYMFLYRGCKGIHVHQRCRRDSIEQPRHAGLSQEISKIYIVSINAAVGIHALDDDKHSHLMISVCNIHRTDFKLSRFCRAHIWQIRLCETDAPGQRLRLAYSSVVKIVNTHHAMLILHTQIVVYVKKVSVRKINKGGRIRSPEEQFPY